MTKMIPLAAPLAAPLIAGGLVLAAPAFAEVELSFYTGWQTAPHSRVNGTLPDGTGGTGGGGGVGTDLNTASKTGQTYAVGDTTGAAAPGADYNELFAWEGKSGQMPPYYGMRATWWRSESLGFGVEFSHNKVYANKEDREHLGFSSLEFTDGHNIFTLNVAKRWQDKWNGFTPYVSGGVGVAIPHVDVTHDASGSRTYEYQVTGPAMRLTAGTSYKINDRYSVFGEYQFTYSSNTVELDGGGTLNTDIKTNALNIGLSMSF